MTVTKTADVIIPEVMANMINTVLPKMITVSPFAKIDTTLVGVPGDTVTVPSFAYIGDAVNVAEGEKATVTKLTASTTKFGVKKIMQAVQITDEALESGVGNPGGEIMSQLVKSIASKVDDDCMEALTTVYHSSSAPNGVQKKYDPSTAKVISYNSIVEAVDVFEEELNTPKVMFVHPKQVTQLRLDPNFISNDKYNNDVMVKGEIGMVAGVRVVPSRRVKAASGKYLCPIIRLNDKADTTNNTTVNLTGDEPTALTIFLKRDTKVEKERDSLATSDIISVNKIYGVAITNQERVMLAYFKEKA